MGAAEICNSNCGYVTATVEEYRYWQLQFVALAKSPQCKKAKDH